MEGSSRTYSFKPARISRITLYDSSGLRALNSWKPRYNILTDSTPRASISSVMACQGFESLTQPYRCSAPLTFCKAGRTTSSTSDRPAFAASLAARLCIEEDLSFTGDVGDVVKELEPLPSRARI